MTAVQRGRVDDGFTLIELLVVMIVIGILAAIAIPAFLSQRTKAIETAAKSDASNLAKVIAAGAVDGDLSAVSIDRTAGSVALTGRDWAVHTTTTSGSELTVVRLSPSNSVSVTGGADYCVTVAPASSDASPWSVGSTGMTKGSSC